MRSLNKLTLKCFLDGGLGVKKKVLLALIFILGAVAGVIGTVIVTNQKSEKVSRSEPMRDFYDNVFDDDFFKGRLSSFKQMEKMQREMDRLLQQSMRDVPSESFFNDWYKDRFGGSLSEIQQEEDNKYVYYKISLDGLDTENVKIDVQDGMVNITGSMNKVEETENGRTSLNQAFQRSFPVPPDVDSAKVEFSTESGQIVIKFPKALTI